MNRQIVSSIEQSRRLLSCGVDPKTADMCIITYPNGNQQAYVGQVTINAGKIITDGVLQAENVDLKGEPAWSLSALLGLLPQSIMSQYGKEYFFELSRLRMDDQWEAQWVIHGERFKTVNKADKSLCKLWDKSPIGTCVKAIEWLTANGYSLNKTEE